MPVVTILARTSVICITLITGKRRRCLCHPNRQRICHRNYDLTAITEPKFNQFPQLLEINFNKDYSEKLYDEII